MLETNHILIAERDELLRQLTRIILSSAGIHRVTEAISYDDVWAVLRTSDIDLLIMEYIIDGESALDHVRQIRDGHAGRNRNVPIIILTDPDDEDWHDAWVVKRATRAGATACVPQPISIKTLVPAVLDGLSRHAAETGSGAHIVAPTGFASGSSSLD